MYDSSSNGRAVSKRTFALSLLVLLACSSEDEPAVAPRLSPAPTRPSAEQQARAEQLLTGPDWYRHAVFYEINVRSFADSNGDGIGDLAGVVSKLDYLKELGIDALWLMPIYPTRFKDSGYDIADYRGINPDYGDMAAFDTLIREAHARKIRVLMDLVLNHTSDLHPWFVESRADKTNPKAGWYVWSDTAAREDIGSCNSGNPMFGPSWTLDPPRGQHYFHRYYPEQPDLDYRNPEVVDATLDVVRFWLEDKGLDGYRADVIGQLYESKDACTMLPETVEYIKKMRGVLDRFPDRAMVAESAVLGDTTPYYGNGKDMFHMAFEFDYGYVWSFAFASGNKKLVDESIANTRAYPSGSQPAQVIGSHDVARAWQSAGGEAWKVRNAALLQMTMRGTPFIYYGDEVGLRPGTQVVVDTRDSARTPMTWTGAGPGHGFTTGTPWIAFGEAPADTGVDVQDANDGSMLTFFRRLLAFRRGHAVWGGGSIASVESDSAQVVTFVREDPSERFFVAVNLTDSDQIVTLNVAPTGTPSLAFGDGELGGTTLKLPATSSAIFALK